MYEKKSCRNQSYKQIKPPMHGSKDFNPYYVVEFSCIPGISRYKSMLGWGG
jgi:hypothetical protein